MSTACGPARTGSACGRGVRREGLSVATGGPWQRGSGLPPPLALVCAHRQQHLCIFGDAPVIDTALTGGVPLLMAVPTFAMLLGVGPVHYFCHVVGGGACALRITDHFLVTQDAYYRHLILLACGGSYLLQVTGCLATAPSPAKQRRPSALQRRTSASEPR